MIIDPNAMLKYGVSTIEMAEAIRQANWRPISEFDICLIELNPNLNWFQKWRLKRRLRKNLKEVLKNGRKSERGSV